MVGWRRTVNNIYAKGKKIMAVSIKYKVNTPVGHTVNLYDFGKGGTLAQQRRILKTFTSRSGNIKATKKAAEDFAREYRRTH